MMNARAIPADASPTDGGRYQPAHRNRVLALIGTAAIYGLVGACLFLTFTSMEALPPASPRLIAIDVRNNTPAPAEPTKPAQKPVVIEQNRPTPPAPRAPAIVAVHPVLPAAPTLPVSVPKLNDAPPPPQAITAPQPPAPPPPPASTNAPDTWQGRILQRLSAYRRYPRGAMARRQQGAPYVRIVMDRAGNVLSARLERSCSYVELDREAVALAKRAEPLPRPPAEIEGQTVELVVPIEFHLR